MMKTSSRVIDFASRLQTKKKGWMVDECWPWHIVFWDADNCCNPKFINNKRTYGWIKPIMLTLRNKSVLKDKTLSRITILGNKIKGELRWNG